MNNTEHILGLDDCFHFQCDARLSCFPKCCSGSHVWLTPYDIVRMKGALGITAGEFLERYTEMHYAQGYPEVKMAMANGGAGSCPFVVEAGCAVYGDRPWVCRLFPLVPVEDEQDLRFEVYRWEPCRGFDWGDAVSVRQWRDSNGLPEYEDFNREWRKIMHHPMIEGRRLREGAATEQFRIACYDIDRFRSSIFAGELRGRFDADRELPEGMATSDAALLKCAIGWLRQELDASLETIVRQDLGNR